MLTELHITNFAIIQELELGFSGGLLIFTGETGAGKSIILDAIMALVGGKVDAGLVRGGCQRAELEASFSLPQAYISEINAILEREELEQEPRLTLYREIRSNGRSVARVNGSAVSAAILKELGSYLVDIHGQSEHLSLLNVRSHLGLLDRFADCAPELAAYRSEYHRLHALNKELKSLRDLEQEAEKRAELLAFQAQEIEAAHVVPEEEAELEQERSRLANAETLTNSAQQALSLLDEGSPESSAAIDLLGEASRLLEAVARVDKGQGDLAEQLESVLASLTEVNRDLRGYLDGIEFNPKRLEQVEDRLELLHQLKRKYGGTLAAVLEYGQNARAQLEKVQHAGERIAELEVEVKSAEGSVLTAGLALSEKRRIAAQALGTAVEGELNDLSLSGAKFDVSLTQVSSAHGLEIEPGLRVAYGEDGLDQVEFMIAPNPGEGLKPLVKIASGGETSRLMLALKNVLVQADYIPTLIFDEIDQGIGGRVGFVVGEKLWRLGRQHQVMCVTHLSQLAAFGDSHFKVQKQVIGARTLTRVDPLGDEGRVSELAQMTGSTSAANQRAAAEILSSARARQVELGS